MYLLNDEVDESSQLEIRRIDFPIRRSANLNK